MKVIVGGSLVIPHILLRVEGKKIEAVIKSLLFQIVTNREVYKTSKKSHPGHSSFPQFSHKLGRGFYGDAVEFSKIEEVEIATDDEICVTFDGAF